MISNPLALSGPKMEGPLGSGVSTTPNNCIKGKATVLYELWFGLLTWVRAVHACAHSHPCMPVLPSNYLDESGYPKSGFPKVNGTLGQSDSGRDLLQQKIIHEKLGYPESGFPKGYDRPTTTPRILPTNYHVEPLKLPHRAFVRGVDFVGGGGGGSF